MLDLNLLRQALQAHEAAVWNAPSDSIDLLSHMQDKSLLRLAWLPSWYASDQSLYRDVWAFYRVFLRVSLPLAQALNDSGLDNLLLSDGMATSKRYKEQTLMLPLSLRMRIIEIKHPKLLGIRSMVWGHNMFLVTCEDGRCLFLDDEEGAGTCDIGDILPDDWNMTITAEVDPTEMARLNEHYSQHLLK